MPGFAGIKSRISVRKIYVKLIFQEHEFGNTSKYSLTCMHNYGCLGIYLTLLRWCRISISHTYLITNLSFAYIKSSLYFTKSSSSPSELLAI